MTSATPHDHDSHLDRIGACASSVCAVHCLLTALALALASVGWLGFLSNPVLEAVFIGVAVSVGLAASLHGLKRHRSFRPTLLLLLGLSLIVVSHFGFGRNGHSVASGIVSALGGLTLVAFHLVNQKMARASGKEGYNRASETRS